MRKILLTLVASVTLLLPTIALAQIDYQTELDATATAVYGSSNPQSISIIYIVGTLIKALLSIVGIVFLVLVLWAGALWMTAGGNEKQVEKAKDMMIRAVIGLVILLASYSISNFVVQSLITAQLAL